MKKILTLDMILKTLTPQEQAVYLLLSIAEKRNISLTPDTLHTIFISTDQTLEALRDIIEKEERKQLFNELFS